MVTGDENIYSPPNLFSFSSFVNYFLVAHYIGLLSELSSVRERERVRETDRKHKGALYKTEADPFSRVIHIINRFQGVFVERL